MRRRNRRARRLLAPRRDTFLWLLSSGEGRRSVACSARRKVGKGDVVRGYTASKAKHAPWWRALRAAGIDIDNEQAAIPTTRQVNERTTTRHRVFLSYRNGAGSRSRSALPAGTGTAGKRCPISPDA